jgi:hypothetical protein
VAHHNHPPTIVITIHRQVIAFVPDSQTGNLLAYCRDNSSANFRSQLTQAIVHLAQARLILCRIGRTELGTRIKTQRVLDTLAALMQGVIEAAERLREAQ